VSSRKPELRSNFRFIIIIAIVIVLLLLLLLLLLIIIVYLFFIIIIVIIIIIIINITVLQTTASYPSVHGPIKTLAPYSPKFILNDFWLLLNYSPPSRGKSLRTMKRFRKI
jgi:hypothetical protein